MRRKAVSGMLLILLLFGMLPLMFHIQPVKASGPIYIRADGSIDPPTAPIQRDGNLYTFTGNITSDTDGIIIERDIIVVDGAGYMLQLSGGSDSIGVYLFERNYVTLKNIVFEFPYCICLNRSSNCIVSDNVFVHAVEAILVEEGAGNDILNNVVGDHTPEGFCITDGIRLWYSNNNVVSGNNLTWRCHNALSLVYAHNNYIAFNYMANHFSQGPFTMFRSNSNLIVGNTIAIGEHMDPYHIGFLQSSENVLYHNNFYPGYINANTILIDDDSMNTVWDNGYPSGGNYWSSHTSTDMRSGPNQDQPSSDGIGDTSYVVDADNIDNYPLMYLWGSTPPPSYAINIYSSPIEVTFKVDGILRTTPWSGTYTEGSLVTLEMPQNHNRHMWSKWLEDSDLNKTKTVIMYTNKTLTATYKPLAVGGIYIPTNKLDLLAPYIISAILLAVATAIVVYAKKRKKQ